jgi:hypothetical protein
MATNTEAVSPCKIKAVPRQSFVIHPNGGWWQSTERHKSKPSRDSLAAAYRTNMRCYQLMSLQTSLAPRCVVFHSGHSYRYRVMCISIHQAVANLNDFYWFKRVSVNSTTLHYRITLTSCFITCTIVHQLLSVGDPPLTQWRVFSLCYFFT